MKIGIGLRNCEKCRCHFTVICTTQTHDHEKLSLWSPGYSGYYAGLRSLCFAADVLIFLFSFFCHLISVVNCHQTLPHVWWWSRFIKFHQKFVRPKIYINFGTVSANCLTWLEISLECSKLSYCAAFMLTKFIDWLISSNRKQNCRWQSLLCMHILLCVVRWHRGTVQFF